MEPENATEKRAADIAIALVRLRADISARASKIDRLKESVEARRAEVRRLTAERKPARVISAVSRLIRDDLDDLERSIRMNARATDKADDTERDLLALIRHV